MYDAIVVGARCAGAPLAMLLARHGHSVLVVDRAHFPSDTMSTHFIQSPGMLRLARWGLLDRLMATGCPPVTKVTVATNGQGMEMELPPRAGLPGLASPRRTILDALLVDAAREAGAEVREGVTVTSLLRDGERVTGIEGRTADGPFRAEGRFVIGADGRHSGVARAVGAEYRRHEQEKGVGYYSYFADVDFEGVYLHTRDDLLCVAFPTHENLLVIAVEWPGRDMKEVRADIDGNFMAALDSLGDFGTRARAGTRAEKYVGLGDIPNFLRTAHGPGWALIGDAAYFKDPAPADGISDAFRAADYLADALHDVFTGTASEDEALARYEQRYDEYALPLLDLTVKVAATDTPAQERLDNFIMIRMLNEQEADAMTVAQKATL